MKTTLILDIIAFVFSISALIIAYLIYKKTKKHHQKAVEYLLEAKQLSEKAIKREEKIQSIITDMKKILKS